jgi:hypothetical protein
MIAAGPAPDNIAVMTIHVNVSGGDGNYTYYWNGSRVDGPTFEIRAPQKSVFSGTISVRSGDGQELVFPMLYEWVAWYATPVGGHEKNCQPWYPGISLDEVNC